MKIFLIGFMGCGKSHHGRKLAQMLDYQFIDLDEWIVDKAQMSIPVIFREKGEACFRQLEAKALRALGEKEKTVIACGGGAPCFHQNMEWMNQHGVTIFLDTAEPLILERVRRKLDKRPLLKGKSDGELRKFISTKLSERRSFYEQAHIQVSQQKESDQFTQEIFQAIQKFST
jgi:shikimate kinase